MFMQLSVQKSDTCSVYFQKKILDFLFYGKSLDDSIQYLKENEMLENVFQGFMLDNLSTYLSLEPITFFTRKQILNYLQLFRFQLSSCSTAEQKSMIQKINQIIHKLNRIRDTPIEIFINQQIQKRFITPSMKLYSFFVASEQDTYKNLMDSITYDLDVLYSCSENMIQDDFVDYVAGLLLKKFTLDSMGAIYYECPLCFRDPIFVKRFFYILEQNQLLLHKKETIYELAEENYEALHSFQFRIRNHEMKRKLIQIQKDIGEE